MKENKTLKTTKKVIKDKNIEDNKIKLKKAKNSVKNDKNVDVIKTVKFNLLEVVIIVIIASIIVSIISGFIVFVNYDRLNSNSSNLITKNDSEFDEFIENFNTILNKYVDKVNKEELLDAAISGMYSYLGDDYSMYLDKDTTDTLDDQLTGEYTGIGIEMYTLYNEETKEYILVVNRVFTDSPAYEAGIQAGDIIKTLDGVDLSSKEGSYVSNTIKYGDKDTYTLTILREEKEIELTITRKKVVIDSVKSSIYDDVLYLSMETFASNSEELVKKELDKASKDIKKIVIDLRNNTGGYLSSAYGVSNLFIEKGKNIYQTKNREGIIKIFKAENDIYRKFDNIVVLVNENSASASEILTLALKESANATVVGVKTYGKGSIQETQTLNSGAMVKYTIAYWLSPNGNSINEIGITPDIEVKDEAKQLEKALEVVRK